MMNGSNGCTSRADETGWVDNKGVSYRNSSLISKRKKCQKRRSLQLLIDQDRFLNECNKERTSKEHQNETPASCCRFQQMSFYEDPGILILVQSVDPVDGDSEDVGSDARTLLKQQRKRNYISREYDRTTKWENINEGYEAVSLGGREPHPISKSSRNRHSFPLQQSDSLPAMVNIGEVLKQQLKVVQTKNRFTSLLSSKPISYSTLHEHTSSASSGLTTPSKKRSSISNSSDRATFHKVFTAMLKSSQLSNTDGRIDGTPFKSEKTKAEENLYQNATGDMIWLELQAWFAGRGVYEHDKYITEARLQVKDIIEEIMNFKFVVPRSSCSSLSDLTGDDYYDAVDYLPQTVDEVDSLSKTFYENCVLSDNDVFSDTRIDIMNKALTRVNSLLCKLESVEQYYASSRMFKLDHPMVGNPDFQARVKGLCLWYNITVELRGRIHVLGKIFSDYGARTLSWPKLQDSGGTFTSSPSQIFAPSGQSYIQKQESISDLEMDPRTRVTFQLSTDEVVKDISRQISTTTELSCYDSLASEELQPLRRYVEKLLKTRGLRKMINTLQRLIRGPLRRAKTALECPNDYKLDGQNDDEAEENVNSYAGQHHPHLEERFSSIPSPSEDDKELTTYGTWNPEFIKMNLPSFRAPYLFLAHIILETIHECLKVRLEQKPSEPSELSIRQLMRECKEVLRLAVIEKQKYISRIKAAIYDVQKDQAFLMSFEKDMEEFDGNLTLTIEVYLSYLQNFVMMIQSDSCLLLSTYQKNLLEEEWNFIKQTCPHIPHGESFSANAFCQIACGMLKAIGDFLNNEIDEVVKRMFVYSDSSGSDDETVIRHQIYEACRGFQSVFHEARERSIKAISFAKTLRKDLEVSSEFRIQPFCETAVLDRLRATNHVQVLATHSSQHLIFVSGNIKKKREHILQLLDMHCGTDLGFKEIYECGYVVLMKWTGSQETFNWTGETINIKPTAETTISLSHIHVEGLLLITHSASVLVQKRNEFIKAIRENIITLIHDQRAKSHQIASSLHQVKTEALSLRERISKELSMVEEKCDVDGMVDLDSGDREVLSRRTREILHQCYKFGFEYHKELDRFVTGEKARTCMVKGLIDFSKQWMRFVISRCEKGRGIKPRWATHGIDFLYFTSSPKLTKFITDVEFTELKNLIEECYSHIIGETTPINSPSSPLGGDRSPRFNNSKPGTPLADRKNNLSRSNSRSRHASPNRRQSAPSKDADRPPSSSLMWRRKSDSKDVDTPDISFKVPSFARCSWMSFESNSANLPWNIRVARSTAAIENIRNKKNLEEGFIGQIKEKPSREDRVHIKSKIVSFPWQRGVKIGQGSFGKVYTAINNETGDIMAMKEIPLQPNNHKILMEIDDELRIFENIRHKHIINHYGVEIHRGEMLIFMEYCPEGTLEDLVTSTESGLVESSVRRYARQLLEAVTVLHENQIVHRDIKGANIFLTDEMQNIKLGDFGCAVKIKAQKTVVGELKEFVGTQAFMAPEVFTSNMKDGHGRAADIWSIGCVVVEMATGNIPWHELASDYQILYKVGMGGSPSPPEHMSHEGKNFLTLCFKHNPKARATAEDLLIHPFLKVYEEDENLSLPMFTSLPEKNRLSRKQSLNL
ncbi:mitogen-activated protein kinase kinase kinase 4 isoform X3 [Lepeophtheirus salmonis]|uniref:mitogen-activated protein kinase kinase kinase 4 isoform X3 n=1 Tax=Lepeophtheirus salmonis TaxID=72036 RepID=UPI001AE18621|nr:mitogen-activated protein kinase kinase kinase 4-like isoform X3 [Lepeophtheirus salmonis]